MSAREVRLAPLFERTVRKAQQPLDPALAEDRDVEKRTRAIRRERQVRVPTIDGPKREDVARQVAEPVLLRRIFGIQVEPAHRFVRAVGAVELVGLDVEKRDGIAPHARQANDRVLFQVDDGERLLALVRDRAGRLVRRIGNHDETSVVGHGLGGEVHVLLVEAGGILLKDVRHRARLRVGELLEKPALRRRLRGGNPDTSHGQCGHHQFFHRVFLYPLSAILYHLSPYQSRSLGESGTFFMRAFFSFSCWSLRSWAFCSKASTSSSFGCP